MSEVKFECPACGQHVQCETTHGGENIPCPNCAVLIRVPPVAPTEGDAAPEEIATPKPDAANEEVFKTDTQHADAVSYVAVDPETGERLTKDTPPEPASEPATIAAAPETKQPSAAGPIPGLEAVCPICHSHLRVSIELFPPFAGAPAKVETNNSKPEYTVPQTSRAASPESVPLEERERKIAAARESHQISLYPAMKPRLSAILSGDQAPAPKQPDKSSDGQSLSE